MNMKKTIQGSLVVSIVLTVVILSLSQFFPSGNTFSVLLYTGKLSTIMGSSYYTLPYMLHGNIDRVWLDLVGWIIIGIIWWICLQMRVVAIDKSNFLNSHTYATTETPGFDIDRNITFMISFRENSAEVNKLSEEITNHLFGTVIMATVAGVLTSGLSLSYSLLFGLVPSIIWAFIISEGYGKFAGRVNWAAFFLTATTCSVATCVHGLAGVAYLVAAIVCLSVMFAIYYTCKKAITLLYRSVAV